MLQQIVIKLVTQVSLLRKAGKNGGIAPFLAIVDKLRIPFGHINIDGVEECMIECAQPLTATGGGRT